MLEHHFKKYIFYEDKQVTPALVVPKPTFPTEKKKIDNPKLNEKGKKKPKKTVPKAQIRLPW